MMTKLSTTVKIIVSIMVLAALVATSWESSRQQPESKRSLRVGKERKLQSLFPDFSAFGVPSSFSAISFNPGMVSFPTGSNDGGIFGAGGAVAAGNGDNSGMMSLPTGDNAEGAVATGFGDNVFTQSFFAGIAGGSGGGVSQSSAGGSIKPVSVGGVLQNQITAFDATAGNTASGFGSGVVGPGTTSDFSGFSLP